MLGPHRCMLVGGPRSPHQQTPSNSQLVALFVLFIFGSSGTQGVFASLAAAEMDGDNFSGDNLGVWVSAQHLQAVRNELLELVSKTLPDEQRDVRSFRALCLRRDLKALLRARPSFGVSGVPQALRSFREFDDIITHTLGVLDSRLVSLSAGLQMNCLYGAWEGGLPAAEAPSDCLSKRTLPVVVSAYNVRGALSRDGGMEAHEHRILHLSAKLQSAGCVVAILGEPRFAPGLIWPDWTGYKMLGERTDEHGAVAALVSLEASAHVVQISGVGDARAIWLEVPFAVLKRKRHREQGMLLLGVYAPQVQHPVASRRCFWQERQQELFVLRGRRRYADWDVMIIGDFNLHFACLGDKNRRYEHALDKEVLAMLQNPRGFGCTLRNPVGVGTHVSGTIIDVVALSRECDARVLITEKEYAGVNSDHVRLDVVLEGRVEASEALVGRASWRQDEAGLWDAALLPITGTLQFLIAWATLAMTNHDIRLWVADGAKRGVRQTILDRAIWWRDVCFTLCGHFGGLVITAGPKRIVVPDRKLDELSAAIKHQGANLGAADLQVAQLIREECGQGWMEAKRARLIDQYLEIAAETPGKAEAFMSGLVKPKRAVQVAFVDETTGTTLDAVDTLDILTRDVLSRGSRAGKGDRQFNLLVEGQVKSLRRAAMQKSLDEPDVPFTMERISAVLDSVASKKRSLHLPRGAVKAKLPLARRLTWALLNLATVLCLVATSWAREISPLRKAGPEVVTDPANLRPVGYLGDLAGVFDAVWLSAVQGALDQYSGVEQAGGKYDAVLMAIGLLIALQVRSSRGLPTLLEKADLMYGFDLAWRDAVRLHLGRAGIVGRLWLVADACMQNDFLRVRIGPLVGELANLQDVGIGQGRRAAVQLFGLLVRSLIENVHDSTVGVGIDRPVI